METKEIYNYVERLNNLLRVDSRKKGALHGLQPVQLEALHYLSVCNRYSDTPMGVTEYLGQTKGTVSQTLQVLKKRGYLIKLSDTTDKRISHLKLTEAGKALLKDAIPTPQFTNACKSLSVESKKEIGLAFNKLLLAMLQSNKMKSFGACKLCRYNIKMGGHEYFCDLVGEILSSSDIHLICREHEINSDKINNIGETVSKSV